MTEPADAATRRAPHDQPFGPWVQTTLTEGWDPEPVTGHPAVDGAAEAAAAHRAALLRALPGRTVVVPAGTAPVRANDTVYPFRAASAYTWLTGDQAEGAVLVLSPAGEATVFLLPSAGPRRQGIKRWPRAAAGAHSSLRCTWLMPHVAPAATLGTRAARRLLQPAHRCRRCVVQLTLAAGAR